MNFKELNLTAVPSLKQRVYDYLLELILSDELKPNTRLLEPEIAEALHISRAPIREAINMLERDGFVTMRPNKGAFVAEMSYKNAVELWEFLAIMQPYTARMSCGKIPALELKKMRNELLILQSEAHTYEEFAMSDKALHAMLGDYLENEMIKKQIKLLQAHATRFRWITDRNYENPEERMISIEEHLQIVNALLEEDPDKVFTLTQKHMERGLRTLIAQKDREQK
ncbi:MAG: GntR family transcriptional regulator [Lachnospiraceae bacterium]|nr:GntR family transcriptional regulator [Lachnospiraceae bacterium]